MKYLYTFGRAGGQPSPFSYERKAGGVIIQQQDGTVRKISHKEWKKIVTKIDGIGVCTITGAEPTNKSLSDAIREALPDVTLNGSELACIVKILEHEGTLELYHGAAGQGVGIAIHFRG